MFPGFKSPPIGLHQTNAGNSLYIPFGTASARNTDWKLETSMNNLVLGSGYTFAPPTGSNFNCNNIIIGVSDSAQTVSSLGNLNITGSRNLFIIPDGNNFNGGVNYQNSWALGYSLAQSIVVLGCYGTSTAPGFGSVSIGGSCYSTGAPSIALGASCGATASDSIAIGDSATATNSYTIALGYSSSASQNGSVAIGYQSTSTIGGGATGIGYRGRSQMASEFRIGMGGQFAVFNDADVSIIKIWTTTTNTTPTNMGLGAATNSTAPTGTMNMPNNSTCSYVCDIVVRNTGATAQAGFFQAVFAMRRDGTASTAAIIGTATVSTVALDSALAGCSIAVTADTTNGCPQFAVTGLASTTLRWVAQIRMTQVTN